MSYCSDIILQILTSETEGVAGYRKEVANLPSYAFLSELLEELRLSGSSGTEQAKIFQRVSSWVKPLSSEETALLAKSARTCAPALKNAITCFLPAEYLYLTMDLAHLLEYALTDSWGPGWSYQEGRWQLSKGPLTLEVQFWASYPKTMLFELRGVLGPTLTWKRAVTNLSVDISQMSEDIREYVAHANSFVKGKL